MDVKKGSFKKKASAVVALMCIAALMLSGTYAYINNSDHKTNEGQGINGKYDVKLIEKFDEIDDWKTTDGDITKQVRVANLGTAAEGYGSVYVRLALKEYMEVGKTIYTYTPERYMVGQNGHFVKFDSREDAEAAYNGHTVAFIKDAVTGDEGWFVQTQAHDPDGQYGSFVVTDITMGAAESLIENVVRAETAATTDHELAPNGECAYPVHKWNGTEPANDGAVFHTYISWLLGTEVISLSDWIDGGAQPVAKWIYDDRADAGQYVYWGEALAPGQTTPNLLESIRLINQPDGSFYYALHVDMEALSIDELVKDNPEWQDAPQEIIDAITAGGAQNDSIIFSNFPSATVEVGDTIAAPDVKVIPEGGSQNVVWSSGDTAIATVDPVTGEVTGVAAGKVTIAATGDEGQSNSYTITVTDPNAQAAIELPLKTPADANKGFMPTTDEDKWAGQRNFSEPNDTNKNFDLHGGAIHLEDIISDGDVSGIRISELDPRFNGEITIGADGHGKPSVLYSSVPTRDEIDEQVYTLGQEPELTTTMRLTRDSDGATALVTITMTYHPRESLFSL
jgi:alternate signal-mediated exported protein